MAIDKARIAGLVGFWAFVIGLVISLVAGVFLPANGFLVLVLVILGIVIGFLNITPKETQGLLLAAIALIVVGNAFGALTLFDMNKYIGGVLFYVTVFVSPAAVIAAIKTLWAIGKPGD